jgi:hypothetical protein
VRQSCDHKKAVSSGAWFPVILKVASDEWPAFARLWRGQQVTRDGWPDQKENIKHPPVFATLRPGKTSNTEHRIQPQNTQNTRRTDKARGGNIELEQKETPTRHEQAEETEIVFPPSNNSLLSLFTPVENGDV